MMNYYYPCPTVLRWLAFFKIFSLSLFFFNLKIMCLLLLLLSHFIEKFLFTYLHHHWSVFSCVASKFLFDDFSSHFTVYSSHPMFHIVYFCLRIFKILTIVIVTSLSDHSNICNQQSLTYIVFLISLTLKSVNYSLFELSLTNPLNYSAFHNITL